MKNYLLCCDWGTTHFRLRLVDSSTFNTLVEVQSDDGIAGTFNAWRGQSETSRLDFYAKKLKSKVQKLAERSGIKLNHVPIIISGMASSSIGMEEVPYAPLPFAIDGSQASVKIFENIPILGNPLILVSGVKSQEDVMRGEEVQLIGLSHIEETSSLHNFEGIFIFPGTHSKHIYVHNGSIDHFQTFMTGEIFKLMSEQSILKDSINLNSSFDLTDTANQNAFSSGVKTSGSSPVLHSLFTVRTNQLFEKITKEQNSFYLSGLLIGSELRHLLDTRTGPIAICCGKNLYNHYHLAAEILGLTTNVAFINPDLIDKATIAGQVQLFKTLNKSFHE